MSTLKVNNLTDLGADAVVTNGVIDSGALPTGSILQVVTVTKTDTFSTASTSFTDLTGLSLTITPTSATNKIYLVCNVLGDNSTAGQAGFLRLVRDSTAIGIADAAGSRERMTFPFSSYAGANVIYSAGGNFVDSPATTSAITYKAEVRVTGGTGYINRSHSDADATTTIRAISTLTALEVAG